MDFSSLFQKITSLFRSSKEIIIPTHETITRYVFSTDLYYRDGRNQLKYGAFIDPRYPGEISVYRVSSLNDEEIWSISYTYVQKGNPAKARGDMSTAKVQAIDNQEGKQLQVLSDPRPHPLHANIKQIPAEEGRRKAIALLLAKETKLVTNS